jgi:hypothetical protein
MKMNLVRLAALVAIVAAAAGARAEETPIWQTHPNHLSLLTAGTWEEDEVAFTLGLDYERRINGLLGLGGVAEHAFGHIDATTLLAVADLHLWRGLAIQTGPGVELIDGKGEEDDEQVFVYRIGALYELEFGRATLSPQLHYDVTAEEHAVIFGVATGFNF